MASMTEYSAEYIKRLRELLGEVQACVGKRRVPLDKGLEDAVVLVVKMRKARGKILLIGNGASAAIASHQAADFLRAAGIRACAFNDAPLITCLGNDLGFERTFDYSIGLMAKRGDILVAISSSGESINVVRGAKKARQLGCRIITLSGFSPNNRLRKMGDVNFYVPAESYGKAEVIHLAVLHCITDFLAGR